ncbi:MAG: hypothetical protein Q8942_04950 [Bacillota bacterium]|nr:hypothetical protein [Bacillota bacterium]
MNYKEIEALKYTLSNMAMRGARIKNNDFKVDGKIVGVGFKPYWSNPYDTKIEKLELNVLDNNGRILPFNFYHIIGYDIVSYDGKEFRSSDNVSIDIHVYSPVSNRNENYDKVRVDLNCSI